MKDKKGIWATLGGIGLFALTKAKFLAVVLKLLKFKTLISMLVSVWAYALLYGWKFGIVLVYLLFVHEMGHVYGAKKKGIPTSPALFIPFLGAVVGMKELPKRLKDDVFISIMGPFAGLLSIIPFIVLYYVTGVDFWLHMFKVGALLNLFNLLPMMPLDGGRIARALSTKLIAIAFTIMLAFTFVNPDPILVLIIVFGGLYFVSAASERYGWREKAAYRDEYQTALQKWESLRAEWHEIAPEDRLSWLNGKLYEEGRVLAQYEQEFYAWNGKQSKWRWTPETEAFKRAEGKLQGQYLITKEMQTWYDNEPGELHSIHEELEALSEELAKQELYEKLSKKERVIILLQYVSLVLVLSGCIGFAMTME
ncbi:site-2 protease family protein [Ectobacillus antri]|uniref:Site-2 protease family protein n=1 Tax=Ectobacillus antri TaxID=2486280 RepID=A0ABT6H8T4_9BACI|nr:site-2 protease family protein [Ectobacillus antri]MDG4658042.1 site-2 protease family protein [Ectobacillus antri]MDG5755067.1 site-2 protease family protein [Ectobacillus antri]